MQGIKRRDPKAYKAIDELFDQIELTPDLGYELRGEWEGCYAVHCARDRYRVIWEILEPVVDYSGETDFVVPVAILRVGPKTDSRGRTIYDEGRPAAD